MTSAPNPDLAVWTSNTTDDCRSFADTPYTITIRHALPVDLAALAYDAPDSANKEAAPETGVEAETYASEVWLGPAVTLPLAFSGPSPVWAAP